MAIGYHEPYGDLSSQSQEHHRALTSLVEELEAIDWYQQRIAVSGDEPLRAILTHNRDEEMDHAMMLLEWLRRNMPPFEEKMKTYLFTTGPITQVEQQIEQAGAAARPMAGDASLGLGTAVKGNEPW
jgi:hypothetical protein